MCGSQQAQQSILPLKVISNHCWLHQEFRSNGKDWPRNRVCSSTPKSTRACSDEMVSYWNSIPNANPIIPLLNGQGQPAIECVHLSPNWQEHMHIDWVLPTMVQSLTRWFLTRTQLPILFQSFHCPLKKYQSKNFTSSTRCAFVYFARAFPSIEQITAQRKKVKHKMRFCVLCRSISQHWADNCPKNNSQAQDALLGTLPKHSPAQWHEMRFCVLCRSISQHWADNCPKNNGQAQDTLLCTLPKHFPAQCSHQAKTHSKNAVCFTPRGY